MSDLLNRIDLRFDFVAEKMREYSTAANGCWEWVSARRPNGYGVMIIYARELAPQKRKFAAHRVSYAFHTGIDPKDRLVCHRCDNPICINPDHLFLGTPKDNAQDMMVKGRHAPQHGENNPGARLTEPKVLEAVEMIRSGLNNKQIGDTLGVTHHQISLIRLGKCWRHILEAANYDPSEYRRFTRKAG